MSFLSRSSAFVLVTAAFSLASCSKEDSVVPASQSLRAKMEYATLTGTTPYTTSFKDASGASTVDLGLAAVRLDMFSELNNYMALVAVQAPATPAVLDIAKLRNLYTGANAPFAAAPLNAAAATGVSLREKTAASFPEASAATVRAYFDAKLTELATASQSVNQVAAPGKAGRLGRYLVDANGYEVNQIIQKGLIGAVLLDQIGNVLLTNAALTAENGKVAAGKAYTEREHNWDLAYGYLTANATMVTDIAITPRERFLAGYLNEKNGPASPAVYIALLKGRAAIVNNDAATLKAQADIVRTELEKTIAKSAVSYLTNWKSHPTLDAKAHALGEGLGFVYSLRFCTKSGADVAWADSVLNGLTSSSQGAWTLTAAQADAAIAAINAKFSL
ncbi:DUF4856 domain-containing protein [Hymenobacter glacialis]|uniref:DUF4856 domain-containing protein n=1 Tax=Hymenobacter glacialis TaxID=1908236 RepID=A0A1G1T5C4_9BACT|nr:DUF4856 domain-containing protein [Hymenobacter glacialis]OGX86052.1 hypothetical protein BEN48_13455 [Hymenobacter glacialis]